VAGLCFVVALVLAAPVVLPVIKPSLREAVAPFYAGIHGGFWFIFKVSAYIYLFMWLRFTLPRYRFDQLMRLGWRFLIPLSIINVLLVGVALIAGAYFHLQGWGLLLVTTPAAILALVAAFLILAIEKEHDARQDQTAASDFYAGSSPILLLCRHRRGERGAHGHAAERNPQRHLSDHRAARDRGDLLAVAGGVF